MTSITCRNTGLPLTGFRRFLSLKHSRGSLRASYSVLRKVLQIPLLRHCIDISAGEIFYLPLSRAKRNLSALRSMVVREAGSKDLESLVHYFGDRALIEGRFHRKDLCIITCHKDQIVAAAWFVIGPGEFHEDHAAMHYYGKISPGTAWIYDGRGTKLGAWGSLMATLPAMLEKRKVHGLAALVECNNWQALDAHRSLRFESTAVLASFSLFGWHRCCCKSRKAFWRTIPMTLSGVELCR